MNTREMERFTAHCDQYFGQTDCQILHPLAAKDHIDVLVYPPAEKYPFWKLVTMGASDYVMPKIPCSLGRRNEYMMLLHADEDLKNKDLLNWYCKQLISLALYPRQQACHITYGHSMEWSKEEDSDMTGAFLELPQALDYGVHHCKLGLMKETTLLQVVLLTGEELQKLKEIGPQAFSSLVYPGDGSVPHCYCERYRTEHFGSIL